MITVGSLFSGIGGIDLGLERAGMSVIWQAETDPYASKVLAKHWPDVPNLGDVKQIDWSTIERPDLICGGFPCQPVSVAGRGLAQADDRWLWPEYARAIRHLRPDHVLVENVPGLLVQPMGDVLGDLATLGYDTEWQGIPAAAVGAPHLRWRIFILAHTGGEQHQGGCSEVSGPATSELSASNPLGLKLRHQPRRRHGAGRPGEAELGHDGPPEPLADTNGQRLEECRLPTEGGQPLLDPARSGRRGETPRPLADAECQRGRAEVVGGQAGGADSIGSASGPGGSGWWAVEPDVGRVAHGIPNRVDRLRCLGNAVVPQVAEWIGRQIVAAVCHCPCHDVIQPGLIRCPLCATDPDHSSR